MKFFKNFKKRIISTLVTAAVILTAIPVAAVTVGASVDDLTSTELAEIKKIAEPFPIDETVSVVRERGSDIYWEINIEHSGVLELGLLCEDTSGEFGIGFIFYDSTGKRIEYLQHRDLFREPITLSVELKTGIHYIEAPGRWSFDYSPAFRMSAAFEKACEYGKRETVKEPTCSTDGSQERTCTICGGIETEAIPATDCDMGDWEVTKKAACTANGIRQRECENGCGEIELDTIEMLEHDLGAWKTTLPTCIADGGRSRECKDCDFKEEEITEATGFGGSGTCSDCGANSREYGDVDGDGGITIGDALEILKHLAALPSVIDGDDCALTAALVSGGDNPTIGCVLEILKKLADLPSLLD